MRVGGIIILFYIRLQHNNFIYQVSLQFLSELSNIFHVKNLKGFTFYVKLIDDRWNRNKKNIESPNLTQNVNF